MPRFRAIIFDLLTALIDSWTLWGDVAGDDELGAQGAGLPVVWHNRADAPAAGGEPLAVIDTLDPLPALIR
jgi:hypothetical protein